jgi:hypothetical protein
VFSRRGSLVLAAVSFREARRMHLSPPGKEWGDSERVHSQAVEPRKPLSGRIVAVSSSREFARILP